MKTTIERMETVHRQLYSVTPVLWRCGELCGLARVEIATPWGVVMIGSIA